MTQGSKHRQLARGEVIRIQVSELVIGSGQVWLTDGRGRDLLLGPGDRHGAGTLLIEALQPATLSWRGCRSRWHHGWASLRRWRRAIFGLHSES
ncbi:hypothetical protein [Jeongeupia chitinilytica]|uniref:DUF2917 domain-containing protein n=1 Tax=Jeongeupia chitinilytica TaxID=1041641 RepID=A0ABQ3H6S3_9NEIS|nr:hypothetical protein [Jeongeupia chitinilytica]GHD69239.1 hypothetical protein GCM10007350_35740 [Jeongeupia chitinilytica]